VQLQLAAADQQKPRGRLALAARLDLSTSFPLSSRSGFDGFRRSCSLLMAGSTKAVVRPVKAVGGNPGPESPVGGFVLGSSLESIAPLPAQALTLKQPPAALLSGHGDRFLRAGRGWEFSPPARPPAATAARLVDPWPARFQEGEAEAPLPNRENSLRPAAAG